MKILILGGTRFLGRHLATEVLTRGHALTLFDPERGAQQTDHAGETLESVEDLAAQRWDACIDTSTDGADAAADRAAALRGRVDRYLYVSSVDVHLSGQSSCELEGDELCGHGELKAAVEGALRSALGEALTVLRPGLIVGPHDQSGRFAYWASRALSGGEFLAPGPRDAAIQLVDVRDVAAFALDLIERDLAGEFDVVGPDRSLTFGELLESLTSTAGELSSVTWVDNGFLLEHGVRPWVDIPLWLTEEGPRSVTTIDGGAAVAAGFAPRPLEATLKDTLDWFSDGEHEGAEGRTFLDRERERGLLSEWHCGESLARQPLAAGHEI